MLMAEGISRRLDPALNIWTLAQPLIAAWMRENRGPEARLREGVEDALRGLRQLPALAVNLEQAADALAGGRIRLHPESLAQWKPRHGGTVDRSRLVVAVGALADGLPAIG